MRILQNLSQLTSLGLRDPNRIYWQLNTPQLYEEAVQRHEGYVAHLGPLVVRTGNQTSLSYDDRFIVAEPPTQADISWGEINRPFDSRRFDELLARVASYFRGKDVFVQDVFAHVDQNDKLALRIVTETAWHNLFTRGAYLPADLTELDEFRPDYTVLHAPGFRAVPRRDGTNSDVFVILHLAKQVILIGGTSYAGEIQKAIFSVMNYLLPKRNILSLEGSANRGSRNEVVLFLGMDGSGKSSLATDPDRHLIADGEIAWSHEGIVSIGRGGYTHILGLSPDKQPAIYETTRRFGTILENVAMNVSDRRLDLENDVFTENTRAAYPLTHIEGYVREAVGAHPDHIILLAKDAFGVLPPLARLSAAQAHYFFLSGYSSQLVPTRHKTLEPMAVFSACYGAPFMPLHPGQYAELFLERVRRSGAQLWLVNTGWIGGAYDHGRRITLRDSRSIVNAIVSDQLKDSDTVTEPFFRLDIPIEVPGMTEDQLIPAKAWPDAAAYEAQARELVRDFDQNFAQYRDDVDPAVLTSQPDLG